MKLVSLYLSESDNDVQNLRRQWVDSNNDFNIGTQLIIALRRNGYRKEANKIYDTLASNVLKHIDDYLARSEKR